MKYQIVLNMKRMLSRNFFTLLLAAFLLSSCATYHISTQSLIQQCASAQKETKVNLFAVVPMVIPGVVTGNNLDHIVVLDKYDKEYTLNITNRTGVRITKKDGTRKTFYFDTMLIQDSMITGKNDHFIGINIKPINLNNIEKIELQN